MLGASATDEILSALAACARTDEVLRNLDLELFDLYLLDSLAVVELLVQLSDRLGLDLSPSEFDRASWATPRKILTYLEARAASEPQR
jgi:D-alanine--poly(phosphoribitol) ligase subunit 2